MTPFFNPYNFVRPLDEPSNIDEILKDPNEWTQDKIDQILLWRCTPPPHDRYTGLSGRITCTMTAKTPVFVSDSEFSYSREDDEKNKHKTYHFFNVNCKDMIPASSLRGSIRSVFEAATNSTFGVISSQDQRLFYRLEPEEALYLVPARVEKDSTSESGFCLRLLTGTYELDITKKNLYAAWIPQYPNPGILKKDEFDRKNNSRHKHLLTTDEIVTIPSGVNDEVKKCWAYIVNTKDLKQDNNYQINQNKGFPHWQVEYLAETEKQAKRWYEQLSDDKKKRKKNGDIVYYKLVAGYVYVTGLNTDFKQYERFFYSTKEEQHLVPLTPKRVNAFEHLMKDYLDRNDSINNSNREGIEPSHFVKQFKHLKEGMLVYADVKNSDQNLSIDAIYPVSISRAMYDRTVHSVISKNHPQLLPPTDINKLCLASRVFGWVSQEADNDTPKQPVAYRGRLRFSNAIATHAITNDNLLMLSILGTPHPTSILFYLEQNQDKPSDYKDSEAKIRGRKFYRHHKKLCKQEATSKNTNTQNRTIKGIYEPDSQWCFTIEFENLQPVELGALLWSLELQENEKQGYHRLGYGKPLGFGSVQIEVSELSFYDARTRYTVEQTGLVNGIEYKAELLKRFRKGMSNLYGVKSQTQFAGLNNISDLLTLLSESEKNYPIHYPRNKADRDAEGNEGFRWFVDKRKGKKESLKPAHNDDGLNYNNGKNREGNRQ